VEAKAQPLTKTVGLYDSMRNILLVRTCELALDLCTEWSGSEYARFVLTHWLAPDYGIVTTRCSSMLSRSRTTARV
jgi:hypothetical protein